MSDTSQPSAGWYIDPEQPEYQRYWDGTQWTTHIAPAPSRAAPAATAFPISMGPDNRSTGATVFTPQPEAQDTTYGQNPTAAAVFSHEAGQPRQPATYWASQPIPTPAPRRRAKGGVIGIALGAVVIVIVVGVLLKSALTDSGAIDDAAEAIMFTPAQQKAADTAARTDAHQLGITVTTVYVDSLEVPTVTAVGREYVLSDSRGEAVRMRMADEVEFGGWSATGPQDWCVWVTAPQGEVKDFEISAGGTSGPGNCS